MQRFFIVGPAGAGKSEFARLLAEELREAKRTPVVIGECGAVLIGLLAKLRHASWPSIGEEWWVSHIHWCKALFRCDLRGLGDILCAANAGYVVNQAAAGASIIVGVRRAVEYKACKQWQDDWIYVDRAGVGAHDSFESEFFLDVCPVKIQNDGDVDALRAKARAFVQTL